MPARRSQPAPSRSPAEPPLAAGQRRVLHVLPHAGGGGEAYVDLLERQPGFTHTRFYLSAGRTPASGAASIPLRWPGLARLARHTDLLHTHGDVASMLSLPIPHRCPGVVTTHGLHMLRRTRRARPLVRAAMAAVIERSRATICTSGSELSELRALAAPAQREKLHLVHNGIDPPEPVPEQTRARIRAELGVAPGAVLAVFAGELEPRKAPLLAATAARRAAQAGARLRLAVAGDGPLREELSDLEGPAVTVLGYRRDLSELLGSADVFLAPAEREGMSLALLEAMGHGLAIVASRAAGNVEAVEEAGLLFAVGDEDGLVSALLRVSGDAALRRSLGRAARDRMLARFTATRFLEETAAIYRAALGEAGGRTGVTVPAPGGAGPSA